MFPKEIIVSGIFAHGTLFFLYNPLNYNDFANLSLICLLNCLVIAHRERQIDLRMKVSSLAHILSHNNITLMIILSFLYFSITLPSIITPFSVICIIILTLHKISNHLHEEYFRLLVDGIYALVPAIAVIL